MFPDYAVLQSAEFQRGQEIHDAISARICNDRRHNLIFTLVFHRLPWLAPTDGQPIEWGAMGCVKTGPKTWTMCCEHVYSSNEVAEMRALGLVVEAFKEGDARPRLDAGPTAQFYFGPERVNFAQRNVMLAEMERSGAISVPSPRAKAA